jgi:hypothetical protein
MGFSFGASPLPETVELIGSTVYWPRTVLETLKCFSIFGVFLFSLQIKLTESIWQSWLAQGLLFGPALAGLVVLCIQPGGYDQAREIGRFLTFLASMSSLSIAIRGQFRLSAKDYFLLFLAPLVVHIDFVLFSNTYGGLGGCCL